MPPSTFIPGRAVERPLLAAAAIAATTPPETFIQPIVFPDTFTPDFSFEAPSYNDDNLVAVEDDTVGRDTRYLESFISEGSYNAQLGMHGRMARIPHLDLMKARRAQKNAAARGFTNSAIFDLKARHTASMLAKNLRHNELLACLQLIKTANYDPSHVLDELDVEDSTLVRETIFEANNLVIDDGNGLPINVVVVGDGARRGLERNQAFLDLLPETAPKILTREALIQFLSLPEGTTRVVFASSRVKDKEGGPSRPIIDHFIWVGRVVPEQDGVNATFGRNYWTPDDRNNQRVYVNELTEGVQETSVIGLVNYYRPIVTGANYGVLIPTTPADEIT